MSKSNKLSKEEKREEKRENARANRAINDLIRRAKAKGAFIESVYVNRTTKPVIVILGDTGSE